MPPQGTNLVPVINNFYTLLLLVTNSIWALMQLVEQLNQPTAWTFVICMLIVDYCHHHVSPLCTLS